MRLSTRWRIAIPYTVVVLVAMATLGTYLSLHCRERYLADLRSDLQAQAQLISSYLATKPSPPEIVWYLREHATPWDQDREARILLADQHGRVVADSEQESAGAEDLLNRPEVQQALYAGFGSATRYSQQRGHEIMYVAMHQQPDPNGVAFIILALPLTRLARDLAHLQNTISVATLIMSFVIVCMSFLVANRITRPLRTLTASAASFPDAAGSGLGESEGYDEIQRLAVTFDNMVKHSIEQVSILAQERNKMANILAHLDDGVLIVNSQGTIDLANRAALCTLGVDKEGNFSGQSLTDVVADNRVHAIWREALSSGEQQESILEMPNTGQFVRVVVRPMNTSPARSHLLVLQDLTQVHRLESIRRDFISNISHELRTPLASLKALVDTLDDGALEDPPAARSFLKRMTIELDALTQMVQELLELSRIESGQVPIEPHPADITEIITVPIERLRPQAERAGLTIKTDLPTKPLLVLSDVERTRQVITNLVHNAIKFTPSGGTITVSAARTGDEAIISISDTGIGIPEDDLPRIFERFYKTDRARSSGGTGLGLAIAKHIVQAHGGRIWASSRPGEGSTFQFTLPTA